MSRLLPFVLPRGMRRSSLRVRLLTSLLLSTAASFLLITLISQRSATSSLGSTSTSLATRMLLVIRTSQNCQSRLTYLLQSWVPADHSAQAHIYLTTDNATRDTNYTMLNAFRNVIYTNCPTTHSSFDLCCKTASEFELFYTLTRTTKPDLQWMCRFDDDQYVNLPNLYEYLNQYDTSKPYYIGRTSITKRLRAPNSSKTYRFATYGAGVCYSRALLERLRPHVAVAVLPRQCVSRGISDDVFLGYLCEIVVDVPLTTVNDRLHSHLEVLDSSFRNFTLRDLTHTITLGFAWDRYKLDWLPVMHQLIGLSKRGESEAAERLWSFLRTYEQGHPENLTDQYDQSCTSYQKRRRQAKTAKKPDVPPPVKANPTS